MLGIMQPAPLLRSAASTSGASAVPRGLRATIGAVERLRPPSINVEKVADVASVFETGQEVTFTVTVFNEGTADVALEELTDDVFGDRNGVGTCVADGSVIIAPNSSYVCQFTESLSGPSGSQHVNVLTALARDIEQNEDSAIATEFVAFIEEPEEPTATPPPTATPTPRPSLGGGLGAGNQAFPHCVPAPSGMIAWWPGNGNANDVVDDHDGRFPGSYSEGKVGQAFNLDAAGPVFVPDDPAWAFGTADFTIDAWFFLRDSSVSSLIIAEQRPGPFNGWVFVVGHAGMRFLVLESKFAPGLVDITSLTTVTTGEWHHVAMTRTGTTNWVFISTQKYFHSTYCSTPG